MKKIKFRRFPHPADIKIRVYGDSIKEIFINTLYALKKLWINRQTPKNYITKKIEINAKNLDFLLYKFIEHQIFLLDTELLIPIEAKDIIITNNQKINASINYTKADSLIIYTGIKAITLSEFEINLKNKRKYFQFVLDI